MSGPSCTSLLFGSPNRASLRGTPRRLFPFFKTKSNWCCSPFRVAIPVLSLKQFRKQEPGHSEAKTGARSEDTSSKPISGGMATVAHEAARSAEDRRAGRSGQYEMGS